METYKQYAIGMSANNEVLNWIDTTLRAQIKKHPDTKQKEVEHLLDYACSSSGPEKMIRMSYEQLKSKSEAWLKTQKKKGADIKEAKEDTKTICEFKDGSRIAELIGENAYKREGFLMSHCVAEWFNKKDKRIYSYRDKDNNPHATFDVSMDGKEISQVKGKGNGAIHPKYIHPILEFFKAIGFNVRDTEMNNLGYYVLDSELERLIKTLVGDFKKVMINKKEYVFAY